MDMASNIVAADIGTAVLVDGENISNALAGAIVKQAAIFGSPIVQRVYGDLTKLPDWEKAPAFEAVHTGSAKNAADMRICIDAVDLVHRSRVRRFVIVSSDRDFTHLAQYLRGRGVFVLGMGEAKTHLSFRKACSEFVELGVLAKPVAVKQIVQTLDTQIKALIKTEGNNGMLITALSVQMRMKHGFLIGQHEKKNWRGYLSANPQLYELDPKGQTARVRLKGACHPK